MVIVGGKMKYNHYFDKIPYFESNRLILRAFTREDMDQYFSILRDEHVQKYLGGACPVFDQEPHITNWLNNINDRLLKSKTVFTWCIEEKKSKNVVGRIDLGGFQKKTYAEISYHIGYDFWNKGYATEVVGIITNFGLKELKLHRIQASVRKENLASRAVLKKNNYLEEGMLRLYPFGKEFRDTIILAICEEENLYNK